jgi:PAS domain S-box-containing protein
MALPALWADGEPPQIVSTLLDALLGMLHLAFVFVRLNDPEGGPSIEMVRVAESLQGTLRGGEISEAIGSSLGDAPLKWPLRARVFIGNVDLSLASARLGLQGEIGGLVAGSWKPDFPAETERLLLDVAANQAFIGLQQARLLSEQRRVAQELDGRVAQRTTELARANEALRESERNSRLVVDSIPGLVALLTSDGDLQFVNRQILEYTGRTVEELKQWGTNDTVHPEDLPHVIQVFTQSIASGSPYEIVQRLRRSDGVYRWFQNNGFPLRDANGHIVRWCVLLTDIGERQRAEDALRASERNLQLIIDTIPALAWSAHPDGSAEFFNQHYLDFMGLSAEQARDWGWTVAVHPDDLPALAGTWQRTMASGELGEAEARLRRQDGEYRWFLFRANPLRDEMGNIMKWYGINTDIEDRKRAEAELRRAYDSFADAQRLSRTGSFITDLLADDHNWSAEAFRIFEFDPATKVTVQRIRELVHPDDLQSFDSVIERGSAGLDVDFVFRIVTSRGAVKHVRGLAHVVEQGAGRPMFVGALQDVTESKVAEEALNRARSELAHVARVTTVSALTASITHEVNQPLSGIITNAGTCLRMLAADPPNIDGARETARRTIRDGNRASEVITRLRALFSKKEFTLESLDLNEAAREVIALSLSDLQRNRIVLQSELADDLPTITGDRIQLQQVILNLLRNASDAMGGVHDRPRQLLIRTEREDGDHVRVTVRDAGVGFDPQSMDKLFDAFYTTKSDGMGIGLSVSRSIVERHHGRLWAQPNDGPGATLSFSIPSDPERMTAPVLRNR